MPTFGPGSHTYTTPAVTVIEVYGAGGGDGATNKFGAEAKPGGAGGFVSIEVSGGTTLVIEVGEGGSTPSAGSSPAGDGGNGGDDYSATGGGGGGATTVTRQSDGVEIAAAGAGGGGGADADDYFTGGGGGARGGSGGSAPDVSGADADGSGVGGDGGDANFGRNGGTNPGADGGTLTDSGVTVVETQTGGGNDGDGEVIVKPFPSVPTNVDAAYVADDEIEFSFDGAGNTSSFDVEMRRDGGSWVSPAGGPSSPSSDGTYSYGPASDQPYGAQVGADSKFEFRVRASNSVGTTNWAYSDVVYTTPIPPHNPSVSRPDANTIQFSWSNKSTIDHGVRVKYREDTGDGYGAWSYFANDTGWGSSVEFDVASNSKLSTDARYQFLLQSYSPDIKKSEDVYADYGNEGNVYFEDDFESGDLSAWDSTNLIGDTGVRSGGGGGDLTISEADTGSNYFYGEGEGSDEGTWIQTDLGDLSGESDVLVRCAFAVASLDDPDEDFGISWYDGSTWHSLKHFGSEYNRQGWFEVSALVPPSHLSADNRIRVGTTTSTGMYGGDHFAVDRVVVSDILHEYTTPAAPSDMSLDTSVQREAAGSWSLISAFTDGVQTHFGQAGGALSTTDHPAGTTSDDYTGLLDGERYRLEVNEVVEQDRRGAVSNMWEGLRGATEATTILPAPTGFGVSNVTASTADYAWQSNHNYGEVLVQYKPTDAGSWTTFATRDRNATAETVTGLRNGEAYDARVVANTEHAQTEDDS
ncbi:fibronectin type III domain-containing protein [Halorubrum ezzemoulense]|uniref:fibronectin type III domain-containing protein n=1 Tax=Halorubrum ezzemoulense TaxID=337243 RepID=UPI00232B60AB|nr:fibronectin type III domain-containing protein [Halorubrum ezzemoulense]MDB2283671.1 fibronectin type III domain-containing protein [Halorubrum ezzemoulense]